MDWRVLPIAIAIVVVAAHVMREGAARGTAVLLLVNWAACALAVHHTGEEYPAVWFGLFDYFAALGLLVLLPIHYARRPFLWDGLVGLIYAGELLCHVARYMRPTPRAIEIGYYFLKYAAWAQILVVGGWLLYALACRRGWNVSRLSHHDPILGGYQARQRATERRA